MREIIAICIASMGMIQCEEEIDDAERRREKCFSKTLHRSGGMGFSTQAESLPQSTDMIYL